MFDLFSIFLSRRVNKLRLSFRKITEIWNPIFRSYHNYI